MPLTSVDNEQRRKQLVSSVVNRPPDPMATLVLTWEALRLVIFRAIFSAASFGAETVRTTTVLRFIAVDPDFGDVERESFASLDLTPEAIDLTKRAMCSLLNDGSTLEKVFSAAGLNDVMSAVTLREFLHLAESALALHPQRTANPADRPRIVPVEDGDGVGSSGGGNGGGLRSGSSGSSGTSDHHPYSLVTIEDTIALAQVRSSFLLFAL